MVLNLSKKLNTLFSLLKNKWRQSPWVVNNKRKFLNLAFAESEQIQFTGNQYLLSFDFQSYEGSDMISGLARDILKSPEKQLILEVSQPLGLVPDHLEKYIHSIDDVIQCTVTIFIKSSIADLSELELIDNLARLLHHKLQNKDASDKMAPYIVVEVNSGNYLFADDLQLKFSKWLTKKPIWVAHPDYYEMGPAAGSEAYFHVRNFFDALSRNKSLDYPWRNFYHRFALGELEIDKALYISFASEKAGAIYTETKSGNGFENKPDNMVWLPCILFDPYLVPPVGIKKLLNIFGIILRNKFVGKTDPVNFNALPLGATQSPEGIQVKQWNKVLITGWYGTETQGDKAILGEVLHFIKSAAPDCQIVLSTLHRGISEQTNKELKHLNGVQLVNLEDANSPGLIREMDAVVVGGGPLMESASMKYLGYIFAEAYKQGKDRVIFGCGVGPIHSKEVESVTRYMLSVCQAGFLRDKESYELAGRLFPYHVLKFACDPAVGFVSRWRRNQGTQDHAGRENLIATLLRANTNEFSPESDPAKLQAQNEALAGKAAKTLDLIAAKSEAGFELLHMNAPWVGGDDRIYNRILAAQLNNKTAYHLVRDYLTLEEHMERLAACKAGFAMRYHGHIFCLAMGIPFVSLDYTGKTGKVSSLVNRIGYSNRSYQWDALEPEKMALDFADLLSNGNEISQYLITEADKLVDLLNQTYKEVFNYCPEK